MLQFPCCYPLQRLCNGLKTLNISPLIIVKFVKESYSSNKVEYVMLCLERKEEWGGGKGGKEGDGSRGKVRRGRDKVGTMRCVKEMEGKNRKRKMRWGQAA